MVKIPSVKKIGESYIYKHKKLIKNHKMMEWLKTGLVAVYMIIALGLYGYFINIASTKWYFLRVEKEKVSEAKFQNEIVKIDAKKIEWEIYSNIIPKSYFNGKLNNNIIIIKTNKNIVYAK